MGTRSEKTITDSLEEKGTKATQARYQSIYYRERKKRVASTMATDAAEWPSIPSVPQATKDLFNRFYELADTKSDDVGRQYSETIFTPDGSIVVNRRQFHGKQGTSAPGGFSSSRDPFKGVGSQAWADVRGSMQRSYTHEMGRGTASPTACTKCPRSTRATRPLTTCSSSASVPGASATGTLHGPSLRHVRSWIRRPRASIVLSFTRDGR